MHENFINWMDLIQIGLTMLACYCCYRRGTHDGFDYAMDVMSDDEDEENG